MASTATGTQPRSETTPHGFEPRVLAKRALPLLGFLLALVLVAFLAPGLGEVRDHLKSASIGLVIVAVLLEVASAFSYVLMFRPIFSTQLPWKTSTEIGLTEVAMGSVVPASGMGGLALGAWILSKEGMDADRIAHRSVAFFLIKSSVNFVAVTVIGLVMWIGLVDTDAPTWLTLGPAALSTAVMLAVLGIPRLGPGAPPADCANKVHRAWSRLRRALITGVADAVELIKRRDVLMITGAIGYWAFDNAVLWATFEALGDAPPLAIILMGYLIGQLGGLLPIPGGIGGIDGGLIGTLVVYGAPAALTAAAVLIYRLILFWIPLVVGAPAFLNLWRTELRPGAEPEGLEPAG